MIKKVSILLLVAVLLLTLIVCFFVKEPTIHCYYLRAEISAELNTEGDAEFLYPGRSKGLAQFKNEDAAPERTLSFKGTEYTVLYQFSAYAGPVTFWVDYYYHKDLGYTGFHSRTGEAVNVGYPLLGEEERPLVTEERIPELEILARQAAAEDFGIKDMDAYTLREWYLGPIVDTKVTFCFSKYINGLPTTDEIRVTVYSDGTIQNITQFDVGMFTKKHTKMLNILAEADTDALIANTVPEGSEMYVDEIKYLKYAITPDGDVVLYAIVTYAYPPESALVYNYAELIFALK